MIEKMLSALWGLHLRRVQRRWSKFKVPPPSRDVLAFHHVEFDPEQFDVDEATFNVYQGDDGIWELVVKVLAGACEEVSGSRTSIRRPLDLHLARESSGKTRASGAPIRHVEAGPARDGSVLRHVLVGRRRDVTTQNRTSATFFRTFPRGWLDATSRPLFPDSDLTRDMIAPTWRPR